MVNGICLITVILMNTIKYLLLNNLNASYFDNRVKYEYVFIQYNGIVVINSFGLLTFEEIH